MSQRSSIRQIAKARLEAMGISKVNTRMGLVMRNSLNRKLQRTSQGQKLLARFQKEHPPLWRQVTTGKLAQAGYNAQMGIGKKRRYRVAAR